MRHGFFRLVLATLVLAAAVLLVWQAQQEPQSHAVVQPAPRGLATEPQPPLIAPPAAPVEVQITPELPTPIVPPPKKPRRPFVSTAEDDKALLEESGVAGDAGTLLDLFRKRTLSDGERRTIDDLIKQLADRSFSVRRKTTRSLLDIGIKSVPLLQPALDDPDPEVRQRAAECIKEIETSELAPTVLRAAARQLALQKPTETAPVLLAYLPFATRPNVSEEIRTTLVAVAVRDGKPEPALVAALDAEEPAQRGAAAEALCRAGIREEFAKVRKLLRDGNAAVRLQAALALAVVREKEAIPVLIELLDQVPIAQGWQAENLLCTLAEGQQPPKVSLGRDPQPKCRDAWAAWWKEHAESTDLARLADKPRLLGYTMVILLEAGRVEEVDAAGKLLWSIDGLQWPLDAQILPGDRVLIAESQGGRVTERSFKGDVLWEKQIDNPLMAQRLPNGHTFIANMREMIEVDRTGKEVFSRALDNATIRKAVKLPNGDIACISSTRNYIRFDSSGKEVQSFPAVMHHYGGRLEVLPNGHLLLPQYHNNRVIECDIEGKTVWEGMCDRPIAAVRLANGNTLVAFMNETRVVELDREGKEVWEHKTDTRVTRAWRR
jgi:hypothetical protein